MALFSVDEVFQMAMQAEESGRLLYETMARVASDPKVVELGHQLAAQEKTHLDKFKAMREAQAKKYDQRRLSLEEMQFVDALVHGKVIPNEAEATKVAKDNSVPELLDLAIGPADGERCGTSGVTQSEVNPFARLGQESFACADRLGILALAAGAFDGQFGAGADGVAI